MILTTSKPTTYTPEEYLTLEVEAETRSEYRNGEIVPMTGGTPSHNQLISALNALLWFGLRGKNYSVFMTDQRLWIPAADLYTYPDAMVIANPLQLRAGGKDTVTNPIFLAEVLSDSTEAYDRGGKFAAYRTMRTFQEYLLLDQTQPHVEQFVKQEAEDQWLFMDYQGRDARLQLRSPDPANLEVHLTSVDFRCSIALLYEDVVFPDAEDEDENA